MSSTLMILSFGGFLHAAVPGGPTAVDAQDLTGHVRGLVTIMATQSR